MNTKPKAFSILAFVVTLSMIATTVSAQPNRAPAVREAVPANIVDLVDANDDAITQASTPEAEPPEPELVLTNPYVSKPASPANTRGLPSAPRVERYTGTPRQTLGRTTLGKPRSTTSETTDPVVQRALGPDEMPPTIQNFEGVNNVDSVHPPDTNGQVGPNHYVQMVNLSTAIYDKNGNLLYGPFHPSDLWPPGDVCHETNDGDVVVLYDQLADRWLLTQFGLPNYPTGPYYQCIAVSKGPEPTDNPNDWYPYTFLVSPNKMNDYPKLGVWPDGYYMSANQFADNPDDDSGAGVWVFERDKMLNGQPATFQYFDMSPYGFWGLLPSNLLGTTPPPAGTPNYFASVDIDWYGTDDVFHIFEFHTDWDNPANSTFALVKNLIVAPFDPDMCGGSRDCIPQPDTEQGLDAISDRLMMHLWYRNFGTHDVLVANHTVDVGGDHAGIRWYEIRDPGADAYIYQQGTFAPDEYHRWMGSIAMDKVGNIALGYSIASETMYPSIRYTGRLAGDPLGVMTQGEGTIINGSGSQTSPFGRWGDYSAMSVDPVDDCTFWYTQEYIETTGYANWQTRIASFRFPSCMAATGRLLGTVESTAAGNPPIGGAKVTAETNPSYVTYSKADGSYGFAALPTGTYTVTAEAYGFQPGTVTGVLITENATTTQDIQLTPVPSYVVSGTVTDDTTGWPLYARIDIEGYPYSPIWSDPVSGYYSVTLASGIPHTLTVSAWVDGYNAEVRPLGLLTADATENFALTANLGVCVAPGYGPTVVEYSEDFEANDGGYTHTGAGDDWEWGTPTVWPYGCASGDKCWGTDLDGHYNDNGDYTLTSPVIDLSAYPAGTILTARWWQAWSTERGFDYAYAEVSINGGPWTEMWRGDGRQRDWTPMSYDISAAAGGNVQLRWRLTSDTGVNFEGYYIDDVEITVGCEPTAGGLLVGNVYSETMPTEALVGATITSDLGETATAMETPLDPNVDDAFYTIFSPAGSHTFTATLRGYGADVATPIIVLSDTVRQDFYLPKAQMYVVSGTVTDASTGWPLYASITVEDNTIWNDPATGYYSITLPEAFPYFFEVAAWVDGYETMRRVVGPLTADTTENFALTADPEACLAPGYMLSAVLHEGFEGDTFPPDGWASYNVDGGNEEWAQGANAHYGDAAAVHDYGPLDYMEDGWLVTPVFTPTAGSELSFWEYVEWASYYYKHSLLVCTSDCDNPPTNYTEIAEFDNPEGDTWQKRTVDLSAYADTPIQLAFRYEGDWADTWWIDDVVVSPASCDLMSGGLVVGNVYDENTGTGLTGASVINDGGYQATTEETPDDPDVDDGFYTLFSPAGSHTFTATMSHYGPDVDTVTVVLSDTVKHDFVLSAGQLSYTPDSYDVTLQMGISTTLPFTLANTGGLPVTFQLVEVPGETVPSRPASGGENTSSRLSRRVELSLDNSPTVASKRAAPWAPQGPVSLVLDDGSAEGNIGVNDGVDGVQFIWLNRFTPDPADFPFQLEQISVIFGDEGVNVGDAVDLLVYEDTDGDGDPSNATLLATYHETVQAADMVTWNDYILPAPLPLYGPGDVLIGVINRYQPGTGGGLLDYPAAIDETASQYRSWAGWWTVEPAPDPAILPPDAAWGIIDDFGIPGNWMVRGSGSTLEVDLVPWLSADPISGTIPSPGEQVINLTFDAGVPEVNQPGEYHAQLRISNDTPYEVTNKPLTMTVPPPDTWGKLAGTVYSLGYCDVNTATLEGAEVVIENGGAVSVTTGADGTYGYWLEAGTYTVTVSADGHVAGTPIVIDITAQTTTTHDAYLRSIEPCISIAPLDLEATLSLGRVGTQTLTLVNAGAGASDFRLQETPGTPVGQQRSVSIHIANPTDVLLDEGFEDGIMPPPGGWSVINTHPTQNWTIVDAATYPDFVHSGAYAAWVNYDTPIASDEWLLTPDIDLTGISNASLGFWAESDTLWCPDGGSGANMLLHVTDTDGTPIATVWDMCNDETWETFEYRLVTVDLSAYGGQTIKLAWQYVGIDGDSFGLDDILLTGEAGPSGIPWLSEDPISGTVDADSTFPIEITFTAFPTMTLGTYTGTLTINTDDTVNSSINVPVTMTISEEKIYLPLVMRNF